MCSCSKKNEMDEMRFGSTEQPKKSETAVSTSVKRTVSATGSSCWTVTTVFRADRAQDSAETTRGRLLLGAQMHLGFMDREYNICTKG